MINYDRIKKDCFWDLHISNNEIDSIINGEDIRRKNMLFEKILLNSSSLFNDLAIFDIKQLSELIENYKVPQFNANYAFRRKNLVEVYFLLIDELKWVA